MTSEITTRMRLTAVYLLGAVALGIGCQPERGPDVRDPPPAGGGRVPLPTATTDAAVCPTPAGGIRLALDAVAGMPANLPVAALRRLCAVARVDSVETAGFASPAVRFDFTGATVWAVQNVPDTDTLVPGQPAEAWAAVGDSLRFADGRLIPRRLGELRAVDSAGFMYVESGDNSEGASVALCRVAGLSFWFDTLPAPADTSVRAFAGIRTSETLTYRRVEQRRDTLLLANIRRRCRRIGVT